MRNYSCYSFLPSDEKELENLNINNQIPNSQTFRTLKLRDQKRNNSKPQIKTNKFNWPNIRANRRYARTESNDAEINGTNGYDFEDQVEAMIEMQKNHSKTEFVIVFLILPSIWKKKWPNTISVSYTNYQTCANRKVGQHT